MRASGPCCSEVSSKSQLSSPVPAPARSGSTGWMLSLCPAAAEGGGCFVSANRRPRQDGGVPNPERSRTEAARRARGRLRRYCAANGLNRLGTLTYRGAGCHDPVQVRADLSVFFRALRETLGGEPLPYVWVPEWHPKGHGFVSIKLLSDLPVGSGRIEEARKAAGYLSKYVAKSFDDPRTPRRHRYDVAQGFQPERVQLWGRSADDVIGQASALLGSGPPQRFWSSRDKEDWPGPPAIWAQWS